MKNQFSVKESLKGKTILIVGGTGFLGRVTLYHLLKFNTDIKEIILVIRKTHANSGQARFEKEILDNPVFTHNPGEREYFADIGPKKVKVVEGDGAVEALGLSAADKKYVIDNTDLFINTAGNVEFNPPVDASLNANFYTTKHCLELVEQSKSKKYMHVSTCYVADRSVYPDGVPEEQVADVIYTPEGVEIQLDLEQEIPQLEREIEDLKKSFDSGARNADYLTEAREQVEKLGKDPNNKRIVEKVAKALKTMRAREALVELGKKKAHRLNRPNVYTYTKSMAEILVDSYAAQGRADTSIVRPSVVESAVRYPFAGWNEGIQGSVAIEFLIYKGHRMIPTFQDDGRNLAPHTYLDVIPVDLVAAGMILAAAAMLRNQHDRVYQISAGDIKPRLTITRMVDMGQMHFRTFDHELPPVQRFMRRNLQSTTVRRKTFERYSSPLLEKVLKKTKSFIDQRAGDGEGVVERTLSRAQSTVDKFYNLTLMKNKIFEEFHPFINGGYPVFANDRLRALYHRLPAEEKEHYFFDPLELDYYDYFSNIHMPGIVKWTFPVMQKRIDAILKAGGKKGESDEKSVLAALRDNLSPSAWAGVLASGLKSLPFLDKVGGRSKSSKTDPQEVTDSEDAAWWLERDLAEMAGRPLVYDAHLRSDYGIDGEDHEIFGQLSDHIRLMSGVRIDADKLAKARTSDGVNSLYETEHRIQRPAPYPGQRFLDERHRDGLILPEGAARPVRHRLYKLQMWFFGRVMDVEIAGKHNIPFNSNHVVVIANHNSHLDYGVVQYSLGAYGKDMGILAAKDYFFNTWSSNTFFSNFMTLLPMDRDAPDMASSLDPAIRFLNHGGPLLIFPEGTRSTSGEPADFKIGLGYLLRKTGADVLPIHIFGTHAALPKGRRLPKKEKIRVRIGELIQYDEIEKLIEGASPTKAGVLITEHLREKVLAPVGAGDYI